MNHCPSKRGRPKDPKREAKTRASLIQAANQALKKKLYAEISIREIASIAGVNSAMISYHFGSKEDLFFAVIQQGISEQKLSEIEELAAKTELSSKEKLRVLMTVFNATHREYPWLSRLIVDQVIMEKGPLRKLFIEQIVARNGLMIEQLIKQFIADGYFRQDLDSEFTRTSLISLMAFPFICAPLLKQAFGVDFYQQDSHLWVDHTLELFLDGCKASHDN